MLCSICKVSSAVVGSIITFWNRRSSAPSFSMELRYSSSVVAPIHCMVPRAKAGFIMLAASIEPAVPPAPIIVWISSINTIISGVCSISFNRALIRSSNCPLYFVPATIPVISRLTIRLLKNMGEHLRCAIIWARPSTMALLPTPGSPINMGLFFLRLPRISTTRCISFSRPITGSSFPSKAALVKSTEKLSMTGVFDFSLVPLPVLGCWVLVMGCSSSSSSSGRWIPSRGTWLTWLAKSRFSTSS